MRFVHAVLLLVCLQTGVLSVAMAGDFGWMQSLSVEAKGDGDGFRARLGARFHLGDVQVKAVIGKVGNHADAYMVLRLGEMSGHPVDFVVEKYQANKGKGWGALAKSLGIKPGSKEFHALKSGHDLHANVSSSKDKDKSKGNSKGKSKEKNKDK